MANQVAYGFTNLKNVFSQRVSQVGVNVIATAVTASLAEHNRQIDALLGLFVRKTTDFKRRYKTPTIARLQSADEQGRARPIRFAGYQDVEFPLQKGMAAFGKTYEAMIKMTVEEANEATITLQSADMRWVRDHILAALFANTNWSFSDPDDNIGTLTIKGLANSDGSKYAIFAGADDGADDNHYLAQASAIADASNPFPGMALDLTEHPDNAGRVIALVPTNLRASVEALSTFNELPDPEIRKGANSDVLVGRFTVPVPGEVFGKVDKVWVSEWRSMPDNYMVATTEDGEKPLAMREHNESELQGFRKDDDRNDYPFYEAQYARRAGFGAYNRVGAVVQRIGNANYAIPTNYGSPMP